MRYIVELNNKKYAIELTDSTVAVLSHEAIHSEVNKLDNDYEIMDIPDLNLINEDEGQELNLSYVSAPIPGMIISLLIREGDSIKKGDPILVLESMKMENEIVSPFDGNISRIYVEEGEKVEAKKKLVEIK